jgi:hypothetical protein
MAGLTKSIMQVLGSKQDSPLSLDLGSSDVDTPHAPAGGACRDEE